MVVSIRSERFQDQGPWPVKCRHWKINNNHDGEYQAIKLVTWDTIATSRDNYDSIMIECNALGKKWECGHGGYCTQAQYPNTIRVAKSLA